MLVYTACTCMRTVPSHGHCQAGHLPPLSLTSVSCRMGRKPAQQRRPF